MWADSTDEDPLAVGAAVGRRRRRRRPRALRWRSSRRTSITKLRGDVTAGPTEQLFPGVAEPTAARAATSTMTDRDASRTASAVHYDPYDVDIDDDPYPTWRRLRDEAPLYRNDELDFYALSRWDDVKPALLDWETYRSGRGTVLEIIKRRGRDPAGDPALRRPADPRRAPRAAVPGLHAAAHARPRTARPRLLRQRARRAASDRDEFDVIGEFGVEVPLRTIGFLFGIPEADQDAYRKTHRRSDRHRRHADRVRPVVVRRRSCRCSPTTSSGARRTRRDDLMTELLQRRGRRTRRDATSAHARRGRDLRQHGRRRRQRDGDAPDRLHDAAARPAPGPATPARRRPVADPGRDRGDPAARVPVAGPGALRAARRRGARDRRPRGLDDAAAQRRGEP